MVTLMRIVAALASALTLLAQAGNYKGEWQGQAANGDIRIALESKSGGWTARISFSLAGNEVPTRVTTLEVSATTLTAEYEFEFGDNKLQSRIEAKIDGEKLEGTYRTKALANGAAVDQGTFKAAREK